VTQSLDHFLFNDAANTIYDFLWHDFCDWYVEISKHVEPSQRAATQAILTHVLDRALRLLHPFMPFVTEELWQHLKTVASDQWPVTSEGKVTAAKRSKTPLTTDHSPLTTSIMAAPWPRASERLVDPEAERLFGRFQAVVGAIRNTKAELNVPIESRPAVRVASGHAAIRKFFESHRLLLQALAAVGDVDVGAARQRAKHAAAMVVDGVEVVMPLVGLIDPARERQRLAQRVEELTKQLSHVEARLRDRQFSNKAPKDVVEQMKERRLQVRDTLKKFFDHLAVLKSM
jgi:valyl-tRNA synthetase